MNQTLQADNSRLRDVALSTKSQYDELAQRYDDDARRIKTMDDEIRRLLASTHAYQEEREELASSFEHFKQIAQSSGRTLSASLSDRFQEFAHGRGGTEFDPQTGLLTISSDTLFEPGTDKLKPEGRSSLHALSALVNAPEAKRLRFLVAGHTDNSPLERTSTESATPDRSTALLSVSRAVRIREILENEGHTDPGRIDVAGFEASQPRVAGDNDPARAKNRRIEIQFLTAGAADHVAKPDGETDANAIADGLESEPDHRKP